MKSFDELMFELSERKALDLRTRRKQAIRMRKLAKSSVFQAKVARKRLRIADIGALHKRALKQAKSKVIAKYSGMDKSDYDALPTPQKVELDNRIVSKRGAAIQKIANKLIKKIKKDEIARVKKAREGLKTD